MFHVEHRPKSMTEEERKKQKLLASVMRKTTPIPDMWIEGAPMEGRPTTLLGNIGQPGMTASEEDLSIKKEASDRKAADSKKRREARWAEIDKEEAEYRKKRNAKWAKDDGG
jgi:hypothetical protein